VPPIQRRANRSRIRIEQVARLFHVGTVLEARTVRVFSFNAQPQAPAARGDIAGAYGWALNEQLDPLGHAALNRCRTLSGPLLCWGDVIYSFRAGIFCPARLGFPR